MRASAAIMIASALALSGCLGRAEVPAAKTAVRTADKFEAFVRLDFPQDIVTVEDAATYLLTGTGYKLDWSCTDCNRVRALRTKPVSPLARRPQLVASLKTALVLIVGTKGRISIDRDAQTVTLTLIDDQQREQS